jgi:hypothetical protein
MKPDSRRDGLLVREVGDELVVYDEKRHRAHHLNRTAALIWRSCDGQTSVAELAVMLEHELDVPAGEDWVWRALERLSKAHLLKERLTRPAGAGGINRRQALRKLGRVAAAAVLVPTVISIVAPAPLQAAICDTNPCRRRCIDLCRTSRDCYEGQKCRIFNCSYPGCSTCTQKKCQHLSTPIRGSFSAPAGPGA